MSRILVTVDDSWYDELNNVAYYSEKELERWIRQHVQSVFPDHIVFPFKIEIFSREVAETKKADLAMIRKDYSDWWIIEVELYRHPLEHVISQARVFKNGEYNPDETAEYVHNQITNTLHKRVSMKRLRSLFISKMPFVLVVVDATSEQWENELRNIGVDVCVFEIYKNLRSRYLFRVFGQYPIVEEEGAHCRPHRSLSNVLEVVGQFTFKRLSQNNEVDVSYEDHLTRWALREDNGKRYLRFIGRTNPLSPNETYSLFRDTTGKYYLRRS